MTANVFDLDLETVPDVLPTVDERFDGIKTPEELEKMAVCSANTYRTVTAGSHGCYIC